LGAAPLQLGAGCTINDDDFAGIKSSFDVGITHSEKC
jgi:hypothetical protein